jgi:hypothetical protein
VEKNGWIDEDNYDFQAGMRVKEPVIITKMVMEDAMARGKKLRVIDVDFAAAYDSTERFAKDMSLRRLGVPKEGLWIWQFFDTRRKMRVLTAYGPSEPVDVECGAWGQGSEEAPQGWLILMS